MKSQFRKLKVVLFISGMFFFNASFAQKLGASEVKQLIVENVYTYMKVRYAEPIEFIAGKSNPNLSEGTPEAVLAKYFQHLAKADVDASLKLWTKESQNLIRKRNATIPLADLKRSMAAENMGTRIQFISQLIYNEYMILEIQTQNSPSQAKPTPDAFALKKENNVWRLTQDLADDPVMCCRDSPQSRIRKVGVPGGEFRKYMDALK